MHSSMRGSFAGIIAGLVFCFMMAGSIATAMPSDASDGGHSNFSGLAQAPEANLFVGSAVTSIDIELPPGRKNLTPSLQLKYSSEGGPSAYGHGWDLPLGKIQRCTKHGVLNCIDATYRQDFTLLLPTGTIECTLDEQNHGKPYRLCHPHVEEAYFRIQYFEQSNDWVVFHKSGTRYHFGGDITAKTGPDTRTLFNESSGTTPCGYTFAWHLDQIEDPNGKRR